MDSHCARTRFLEPCSLRRSRSEVRSRATQAPSPSRRRGCRSCILPGGAGGRTHPAPRCILLDRALDRLEHGARRFVPCIVLLLTRGTASLRFRLGLFYCAVCCALGHIAAPRGMGSPGCASGRWTAQTTPPLRSPAPAHFLFLCARCVRLRLSDRRPRPTRRDRFLRMPMFHAKSKANRRHDGFTYAPRFRAGAEWSR